MSNPPHPFQAAIVDLDGTMVDTLGDFEAALNAMLDTLSLPHVDRPAVGTFVGKGSGHLIRRVLQTVLPAADAGRIESLFPSAWDAYQAAYDRINGRHAHVFPGVAEGLASLHASGLRLACLTNKPVGFARQLLEIKGLASCFEQVFGGDSFERKKPDPLPLLKTCEALGTEPARTLMIGDSSNDAQAARAAGCPVVLVTYGYNHGEPVRLAGADAYVDSMTGIAALLGKLTGRAATSRAAVP
ncbi:phosphoglycolate phosphatase [Variovorax sp. VNK109]|uniref:phosphoglycolate phosphatase n=1 Tax=Variovorax sp. VNK109 TaxID=3400919 RepID=UPI003C102F1D